MRGTLDQRTPQPQNHGIIPAHAGNTRAGSGCPGWPGDHPRACGEHNAAGHGILRLVGSSPRMRGTQNNNRNPVAPVRIIPAHAGNTALGIATTALTGDHPRACGEHDTPLHTPLNVIGSSPRMRGTPAQHRALLDESRIIPAHAGNTSRGSCAWYPRRDHPRACGEHHLRQERAGCHRGSSPRMRGTLLNAVPLEADNGIIPAHAGNTSHGIPPRPWTRDHPRACGEHLRPSRQRYRSSGSSPRMRGTPLDYRRERCEQRIIPAHAGNTCKSHPARTGSRDHPRACGEHPGTSSISWAGGGSSPRMRGTLGPPQRVRRRQGIIPAHAGNTRDSTPSARSARDHPRACGEHHEMALFYRQR